jgi:hypothetical protein
MLVAVMFRSAIVLLAASLVACHSSASSPEPTGTTGTMPRTSAALDDWQKSPSGVLAHLNDWHIDALEAYERPELGISQTGEVGGWVFMHQRLLARWGYRARWNVTLRRYELVPSTTL